MFKLFPSEQLIIETETNPMIDERKQSRYLLVVGIVLIFVAIFYRYASAQDFVLAAVLYISIFGIILSLGAYFFKLYQASKGKGKLKYYVTSTRVVETDENGKVNREMLLTRVKRVDTKFTLGKSGDVIINPKELSAQEDYKQRLKGVSDKKYAKETFVIKSIANAKDFAQRINK